MDQHNPEGFMQRFRSTKHEVVERKDTLRDELERKTADFLQRKGKIREIPLGVTVMNDYGVKLDENGNPVSGFPGIIWNAVSNQWQIFVGTKLDRSIGYKETIVDALKVQKAFNRKATWNFEGKA